MPHELCDVLVVFGNDVIVFSDKSVAFPTHHDLNVAWRRWYRKAIHDSAKQLRGAVKWIRQHPERIYADAKCTKRLRAPLPDVERARYHLVAIAWGAGDACQAFFGQGSSPSLCIKSDLVGDEHYDEPFCIGRVDSEADFIHVFDDSSLQQVMAEIDTTRDFVEYLNRRTALLGNSECVVFAPGEEELLAAYLTNLDKADSHSFLRQDCVGFDAIMFPEGDWHFYINHQQRQLKVEANRVSYLWDALIEHFIKSLPDDSEEIGKSPIIMNRETTLRLMASESRLSTNDRDAPAGSHSAVKKPSTKKVLRPNWLHSRTTRNCLPPSDALTGSLQKPRRVPDSPEQLADGILPSAGLGTTRNKGNRGDSHDASQL